MFATDHDRESKSKQDGCKSHRHLEKPLPLRALERRPSQMQPATRKPSRREAPSPGRALSSHYLPLPSSLPPFHTVQYSTVAARPPKASGRGRRLTPSAGRPEHSDVKFHHWRTHHNHTPLVTINMSGAEAAGFSGALRGAPR